MSKRWTIVIAIMLAGVGLSLGTAAFLGPGGALSSGALFSNRKALNPFVLEIVQEYPNDGSLAAMTGEEIKSSMGVTQDLYYKGRRMIEGDPQRRSYCIGLMFEVYMKACERAAGHAGFALPTIETNEQYYQFRRDWYGVDGNRRTLVRALSDRGLAQEIRSLDDALPGDFVQFWRHSGSGHSAVLLKVERDASDNPSALVFWSVHTATGVSQKREEIGSGRSQIDSTQIHIARALTP